MEPSPNEAQRPLIYLSRLSHSEARSIFAVEDAFPRLGLGQEFRGAKQDAVLDRIVLAGEFFRVAQDLRRGAKEEAQSRAAVNRAYYSVHHAIRAILLHFNHWDAEGHEEAIQELRKLLKDPQRQTDTGLDETVIRDIRQARTNREVADYSPYRFSRVPGKTVWLPITGGDFHQATDFNVTLAQRLLKAAYRIAGVGEREA